MRTDNPTVTYQMQKCPSMTYSVCCPCACGYKSLNMPDQLHMSNKQNMVITGTAVQGPAPEKSQYLSAESISGVLLRPGPLQQTCQWASGDVSLVELHGKAHSCFRPKHTVHVWKKHVCSQILCLYLPVSGWLELKAVSCWGWHGAFVSRVLDDWINRKVYSV